MTHFFNAFHSPLGAHSTFTLGCKGKSGGLGLELPGPARENVYIGLEHQDKNNYWLLPFYESMEDESLRYDFTKEGNDKSPLLNKYKDTEITREFNLGNDTFMAGDLTLNILSSSIVAPDPLKESDELCKFSYCPSIAIELTIDNRKSHKNRKAFFGIDPENSSDALHINHDLPKGLKGFAKGRNRAIFTNHSDAVVAQGFSPEGILLESKRENYNFGLGNTGLIMVEVPKGEKITISFAICFFRDGMVTTGVETSYWYRNYFNSLSEVGRFTLENFTRYKRLSESINEEYNNNKLNESQRFQLIHSIRSYFGSTQLLNFDDKPFWVVNEGEYRMMNTFDLTVDQIFFEMRQNPWTVKNELNMFINRFSYRDKLHFPGEDNLYQGGISFTHDMGVNNHISREGYSTYEKAGLTGCFSYMTHEQLVNWVLCAGIYVDGTSDNKWLEENRDIFESCLTSMVNRDNPDPIKRNGLMSLDSSRTIDGAEITTYDSLDESLGQARQNIYMAVKCWASYLILGKYLQGESRELSLDQAKKASDTISSYLNKEGYIPAIIGENNDSKIIPAVEGLIFPYYLGMEEELKEEGLYGGLIKSLKTHIDSVLKKGICLYEDNGWKLSSSADNSWLSKIYLCQFVTRKILGIKTKITGLQADMAHHGWLLNEENLLYAWSDQMRSGIAHGSKYYPRGVTSILWLDE
ncbi:MAG: hypothetical protein PF447_00775 [Spirochaetaceae bacterium]|jgi:hypothetical protein|nr:hypothetical protein [Spirochaetaceae bacterium]